MKTNKIIYHLLIVIVAILAIFAVLGIVNGNVKQTASSLIFIGSSLVFIIIIRRNSRKNHIQSNIPGSNNQNR